MAIDIEEIIRINTAQGEENLRALRNEITQLRAALANLEEGSEEYDAAAKRIYEDQQRLAEVFNASKKYTTDAEGSFNALNAQLRQLKEEWKSTADDTRRAELGEQINSVKDKLNGMNESIGNFQHNVGNYTNGIVDAFSKMGISVGGTTGRMVKQFGMIPPMLGGIGSAFKKLWVVISSNPIGALLAVVGALVGVFMSLKESLSGSEENSKRLNVAMAKFRPIIDAAKKGLELLGKAIIGMIEYFGEFIDRVRIASAELTDFFGITEGKAEKVRENIAWNEQLAKSENEIIDLRRQADKLNAEDEEYLALLREQVYETKDLTERTKLLNDMKEAATRITERNVKLQEKELELLIEQSKRGPNSVEENDKIAAAENRLNRERARGSLQLSMMNRMLLRTTSGMENAAKGTDELAKEVEKLNSEIERFVESEIDAYFAADKLREEAEDKLKSETMLLAEEYHKRKALMERYGVDTTALTKVYNDERTKLLKEQAEKEFDVAQSRLDMEQELEQRSRSREADRLGSSEYNTAALQALNELYSAEFESYTAYIEGKIALNERLLESYAVGSEERMRLEFEVSNLQQDLADKEMEIAQKQLINHQKIQKARYEASMQMADGTAGLFDALASAMGESTKAGKAFAIASATIDTIAAAVSGFRAGYNQWKDAGPMAWMAPVQGALNSAAALVAGYAQVQKIASVDTSGKNTGAGSAVSGATALAIPNIAGLNAPYDYTRQITTQTEREELNRYSRVYILESDIQESNKRVKIREDETNF